MPNNYVEPGDAVRFLDSNGDEQIVAEYDEAADQLQVNDADGNPADQRVDTLEAESLNNDQYYAGAFDGDTPVDRLNNAISASTPGDTIYLENDSYGSFSVSDRKIVGTGIAGSVISGTETVTLNGKCVFQNFQTKFSSEVIIQSGRNIVSNVDFFTGDLTVRSDKNIISQCSRVTATFDSGTSGNVIDTLSGDNTITDNGTNIVGDIA